MLIPATSLTKLARLVANTDELSVGTTGKSVVFIKEDFMFSARLLEGEHVDAGRILECVLCSVAVLTGAAALRNAVSSVTVVAGEEGALSLHFADDRIRVSCEGEGCSSQRELEVVALSGVPEGEYWYNPSQLLQCLVALGGTLMLEVGQNGVLLMRTDELVCLQLSRRKPAMSRFKDEKNHQKAAEKAA